MRDFTSLEHNDIRIDGPVYERTTLWPSGEYRDTGQTHIGDHSALWFETDSCHRIEKSKQRYVTAIFSNLQLRA